MKNKEFLQQQETIIQKHKSALTELFYIEKSLKTQQFPPATAGQQETQELKEFLAANSIEKYNAFNERVLLVQLQGNFRRMATDQLMDSINDVETSFGFDSYGQTFPVDEFPSESIFADADNLLLESVESSFQSIYPPALVDQPPKRRKIVQDENNLHQIVQVGNNQTESPQIPSPLDHGKSTDQGYQLLSAKLKIGAKSLCSVLPKASKVVTTRDWKMAGDEVRISNVLDRVDRLKESNLWSFKQLKRQAHPPRQKVQWDYMLEEMEWMSEDFRQERRWKIATAYNLAKWVKAWHEAEDKSALCYKPPPRPEKPVDPQPATIDPQLLSLPININLDSNCYTLESSANMHHGLSHLPTYGPPPVREGDQYLEDVSIVPISKFMLADFVPPPPISWDHNGKRLDSPSQSPPVKRLPSNQTYTPLPTLFGELQKEEQDAMDRELLHPPSELKLDSMQYATSAWTSDEEDALWQLCTVYSGNWNLISDSLNGCRVGNSGRRGPWACYEKYLELANAGFVPQGKSDSLYACTQTNRKDRKVKMLGYYSLFGYIVNLSKRGSRALRKFYAYIAKHNKQVNLTAHETHRNAQIAAGIDLNAPPLRPLELTRLKETKEKILEQSRQQQHQFARPMQRPLLGVQYRNMIRPVNGGVQGQPMQVPFRPAFQGSPQQMHQQLMNAGPMGSPSAAQMAQLGQQRMTNEQIQQFAAMQQQRGPVRPMNEQFNPAMAAPVRLQHPQQIRPPQQGFTQQRTQLVDASTAAAYASLQNAVSVTNGQQIRSQAAPSSTSSTPVQKKKSPSAPADKKAGPSSSPVPSEKKQAAPPKRAGRSNNLPSSSVPKSRSRRKAVPVSETEEEEEDEEDEEDELASAGSSTSVEESEPASPEVKKKRKAPPTKKKGK